MAVCIYGHQKSMQLVGNLSEQNENSHVFIHDDKNDNKIDKPSFLKRKLDEKIASLLDFFFFIL